MNKIKLIAAVIAAIAMPLSAQAQSQIPGYATATFGLSDYENISDTSVTGGVRIGVKYSPFFHVEGGYMHFGEVDVEDAANSPTFEVNAFYLAAKPTMSTNFFDFYARLGVSRWDASLKVADSEAKNDGFDFMYGAGFDMHLTDRASVGLSYTNFDTDDTSVGAYEANLTYAF